MIPEAAVEKALRELEQRGNMLARSYCLFDQARGADLHDTVKQLRKRLLLPSTGGA